MTLMEQIEKVLQQRQLSTDNSQMTVDRVLDSYPQLVTEDFRAWHATQVQRLGIKRYIELAERAIKYGKYPAKLFSTMLSKY